uniref:MADF domain-containing protein n=1 Tax=Photinus pyralis TaxID=7054 RepID=A0A1Y1MXA0_PHOPY
MSWSNDQVSLLIEQYQQHECLYFVQHRDYHNKNRRNAALQQICEKMNQIRPNTSIHEIQKKWNGIRNTYASERRKSIASSRSGAGSEDIYIPSLWYYEKLVFLNEHLNIRKSVSSYATEESENYLTDSPTSLLEGEYELQPQGELHLIRSGSPVPNDDNVYVGETATCRSARKKYKKDDRNPSRNHNVDVTEKASKALDKLTTAVSSVLGTSTEDPDEVYAKYICSRIGAIQSRKRKLKLQHHIETLIFNAEIEEAE